MRTSHRAPHATAARAAATGLAEVAVPLLTGAASAMLALAGARALERTVGAMAGPMLPVAWLGGMGVGAAWSHRRLARRARAFVGTAAVALAMGGMALPPVVAAWTRAYEAIAPAAARASMLAPWRVVFLASAIVPALLAGAALRLAAEAARPRRDAGTGAVRAYATYVLGAAAGALATTQALLPLVGQSGALDASVACSSVAAMLALVLDRGRPRAAADPPALRFVTPPLAWRGSLAFACAAGGGSAAFFALASRAVPLLVDDGVYARGLVLFAWCLGAGVGALASLRRRRGLVGIANAQALAGAAMLVSIAIAGALPRMFERAAQLLPSFALSECARVVAIAALFAPTAVASGAAFGVLLRAGAGGGARVGGVLAAHVAGGALGLFGAVALAPALGTQASLVLVGFSALALGAFTLFGGAVPPRARGGALAWAVVCAVFVVLGRPWDPLRLRPGARVVFAAEDSLGHAAWVLDVGGARTLRSDRVTFGADGRADAVLALAATPFVAHPDAALAIGLGAGTPLAMLVASPFARIDAVERSPAVVRADRSSPIARTLDALADPRVHLFVDEGTAFLRAADRAYDLVVVRPASLATDGELYDRALYRAAKARLRDGGVVSVWVPLGAIAPLDLARVLATARAELAHVTLWVAGDAGAIVASDAPLVVDATALASWGARAELRPALVAARLVHPFAIFGDLALDEPNVDAFVDDVAAASGVARADLVVDGARPTLAYAASARPGSAKGAAMEALAPHATASLLAHVRGLAPADERLVLALAARERGFRRLAREELAPIAADLATASPKLSALFDVDDGVPWP